MAAKYPDDNTNSHVTAIMVVLKVFPQIMKEMICNDFPPQTVIKLIENNKKYKANITEMKMSNLRSNGYDNLEISFLYHIIRSLSLLPEPNQGWGNSPLPEDKNKEDDVERMKNSRNDIIHRRLGDISESMLNEFLKESLEIAKRMDDRIGYPKKFFESKLEQIQSYMVTREKYTEALESLAEYRGKLQETPEGPLFELYYDNNIHMKIVTHEDQDENGDSRSACTIYLRDPSIDAKTVIQNIDAIKEIISKGHYAINLEGAYIGSLKLNVTIRDTSFITKEKLLQTVQSFLHEFFLAASIPFKQGQIYTVVLAESDYLVEDDEKKSDFDYLNENLSPVLKLNVSVKDSAFRNEFVLYREVNSVIAGMRNSIKRDNVPSNGSAREALILADNEFSRSSTTSSTYIQDFQQRQIHLKMSQSPFENVHLAPKDEMRIVLLGKTGYGKSKTGNTILGTTEFASACSGQSMTETCDLGVAKRFGKTLNVVDTPGVFDTRKDNDSTQKAIKGFIDPTTPGPQKAVKGFIDLTTPGPHAFILCVPMGRFTREDIATIDHFVNHVGEALMQYVIVLFTRFDDYKRDMRDKGIEIGHDGENIDNFIKTLTDVPRNFLQKCNNRYIAFDNTLKGKEADEQVRRLINLIERMVKDNGGSHYTNDDYKKAEKILTENIAEEKAKKDRDLLAYQQRIRKEADAEVRKIYEQREKTLMEEINNIRNEIRRARSKKDCNIL